MIYTRFLFCLLFLIAGCAQPLTRPGSLAPAPQGAGGVRAEVYYDYLAAQSYVSEKQFDKAIEAYEKALKIDPQSPILLTELAVIYLRQGKIDPALKLAEQSIQSAPDYAPAYLLLGQLYAARGANRAGCRRVQASHRDQPLRRRCLSAAGRTLCPGKTFR